MALEDIEKKIYKKENQVELDKERVNNTQYSVYAKHDQATIRKKLHFIVLSQ